MKLSKLIDRYLSANTSGAANETYFAYRRKLNYLVNFVGDDIEADDITPENIEGLKMHLTTRTTKRRGSQTVEGKLSPFTIFTTMRTIKYFFGWAYENDLVEHNPMRGVKIPTEPKPKPKAVSNESILKMLDAAAQRGETWERARNVAIIFCLADTGARVSGLANAMLDDLDLGNGTLVVTEKGDDDRALFLNSNTNEALKIWLQWRSTLNLYDHTLFVNKFGTRLTRGGIEKMLRRIADQAGVLDRSNPHAFRHAFAKQAIQNGIDLSRLSQLMGHSCEAITDRYYTQFNTRELQETHKRFSPGTKLPMVKIETPESELLSSPEKKARRK